MTESGSIFQIAGAAKEKPRDAIIVLVRGTDNRGRVDERNEYPVEFAGTRSSLR